MGKTARTEKEWIQYLFANVHTNDKGCLISHLATNAKGYVALQPGGRAGKKWRAHRFVYFMLICDVPEELLVMHSCDVRNCINPAHLVIGTAKDNTQDMMAKGRNDYRVHRKVTPEHVLAFREMAKIGMSNVKIAAQFGLSHETVRSHLNGETIV